MKQDLRHLKKTPLSGLKNVKLIIISVIIVICLSFVLVLIRHVNLDLARSNADLESEKRQLENVAAPLEIEFEYLSRPERVAELSRRLGLERPQQSLTYE